MVSDNPESFADLDGHDGIGSNPYAFCSEDKACSSAVDNCGDAPGACQATLAGEFLRDVTVEDANGQTEPADEQKADDEAAAAKETAAATVPAADQAIEKVSQNEVDRVAEPLIESAFDKAAPEIGAGIAAGLKIVGVIAAAVAEATVLAPSAGRSSESTMLDKAKGLPPDAVKLKRGQGYRDKKGNTWRKDKLHKDHWDVVDRKGRKVKEVTFDGRQIWPGAPKQKNP